MSCRALKRGSASPSLKSRSIWLLMDLLDSLDVYDLGVVIIDLVGASGGILTVWDSRVFAMESHALKASLWLSIKTLLSSYNVMWIVIGDFNGVRSREERSGRGFNDREANVFIDFIACNGLFDFPFGERKFSIFDKEGKKASKLDSKLVEWDIKAEAGLINEVDVLKREEWMMDLSVLYQIQRDDLRQKCRMRWAIEGDENTRAVDAVEFWRGLDSRFVREGEGERVWGRGRECGDQASAISPDDIKQAAVDNLSLRFKECDHLRPLFSSHLFRRLSPIDSQFLESNFSLEEVKSAVWDCAGSKAPGPDGFNFNFINSFWDVLKVDFSNYIKIFEATGNITNGSVEALQVTILEACKNGVYNGVSLAHSGANMASGLKVNIAKSRLYGVGVSRMDVDVVASSLGCDHGSLPFIYLGLPVGRKINHIGGWNEVVNRIRQRLSSWKANSLSIGEMDIQEKDKNRSQNDKTEHENGKSVKEKSSQKVKVKSSQSQPREVDLERASKTKPKNLNCQKWAHPYPPSGPG
ncbi:RNA-directed DNA polymerase, eukaryota, partial [Tanacetum coccineum]